jgi:hypothetical protein
MKFKTVRTLPDSINHTISLKKSHLPYRASQGIQCTYGERVQTGVHVTVDCLGIDPQISAASEHNNENPIFINVTRNLFSFSL